MSAADLDLFPGGVQRDALVSECGRYRWWLTRTWAPGPRVVFVMLNPSTADAREDDPTIRRCIGFARAWGFGGVAVANLFPWRATDPDDLVAAHRRGEDVACRDERDRHLARLLLGGREVRPVAAWGAHPLAVDEWRTVLRDHVDFADRPLDWLCLGTTKAGAPRHPLYLRADTKPGPWTRDGGLTVRRHLKTGRAIATLSVFGWSVSFSSTWHRSSSTGPEAGAAGREAADRAARAMGWVLD